MTEIEDFGVTAYDPHERFFGSRYKQGGRTVYGLDFSVSELVTFLPKPDPDKPLDASDSQRRIYPLHAKQFGEYVETTPDWVAPALLLRGPSIFEFDRKIAQNTGTTQFGVIGVPKDSRAEIKIVDGQHRTLGFHMAWESLNAKIMTARANLARAKEDAMDAAVVSNLQAKLDGLVHRRTTLASERVSVQIVVTDDPRVARRIFVDINDNAKGITGSVRSRFDDRKVISRALDIVLNNNELLKGRVDLELDRITGGSPYLLGAKHVADMLRALTVGNGRIGKRLEEELDEQQIAYEFEAFSNGMVTAFPDLRAVQEGDLAPASLRASSLLGSSVILRGFAAAWYELREEEWEIDEITEAFANFAAGMQGPVYPDPKDTWFATGLFSASDNGVYSPNSRAQDFKQLTTTITEWASAAPKWKRIAQG
ncbi:DNA sulfur modification protein DndB [Promicromonospora kroppenstedtii]|uniref:DNA sulfur modification protein DndB n=1 Tax=Promicromonospora kroppenstedtii TaxID=440482 RepID=A0ABW7XRG4_9MICO